MSYKVPYLHSHSAIEREKRFPKHTVLIDMKYAKLFESAPTRKYTYQKREYLKVNILDFVKRGGRFKNLSK